MLYVEDAGIVLRSSGGFARMMAVRALARHKFRLMVSENKTEAMRLWAVPSFPEIAHIKAVGQRYRQMVDFVHPVRGVIADADIFIEMKR